MSEYQISKNRELTTEEKNAAIKLKSIWLKAKIIGMYASQAELAAAVGMTQSAASHYINARRQLGLDAPIKFCSALDCQPIDIYPELVSGLSAANVIEAGDFMRLFMKAPSNIRDEIMSILKNDRNSD